jgi:hypothetical protein
MKMLTFSKKVRGVERTERIKAQILADRKSPNVCARKYVEKMPQAIQGSDRKRCLAEHGPIMITRAAKGR